MMPSFHLPEDWLVAYVAGTLPMAEAVVAATHLTLCPLCRDARDVAESLVAGVEPVGVPLDPGSTDALLARLDAEPAPAPPPVDAGFLPRPVLELSGPLDQVEWRWLAPFVRGVDLPVSTPDSLPLRLVLLAAGRSMPHRHRGREVGVVLQGGWTDATGHFQRGDVAVVEGGPGVHDQVIDPGVDCLALVLNETLSVPEFFGLGPLISRFFKI